MASYLETKGIYLLPTLENLLQIPDIHRDIDNQIWIMDEKVAKLKAFQNFKAKHIYLVSSGEKLKDVDHFPQHLKKILHMAETIATKKLKIFAVGGGSVGDFAGFIASILRRGVDLIHVPTTWLSCIDSAHGGKTALNVESYKNQIGTFYPAQKIYLLKDVLDSQPLELKSDAYAELFKIALLRGEKWLDTFMKDIPEMASHPQIFWNYVLLAIEAKYFYIEADPKEMLGIRTELNLGHTLAHILENNCGLRHGQAVGKGLHFALAWSAKKSYMKNTERFHQALEILGHSRTPLKMKEKQIQAGLARDKKLSDRNMLRFIFLLDIGKAKVEEVSFRDFMMFADAEGWLA
jgi:3-dehydroquinate synthase